MADPADIVSSLLVLATGGTLIFLLIQINYGRDITDTIEVINSLAPAFVFFLIILFFGLTLFKIFGD